jgi:hypothetical protein
MRSFLIGAVAAGVMGLGIYKGLTAMGFIICGALLMAIWRS